MAPWNQESSCLRALYGVRHSALRSGGGYFDNGQDRQVVQWANRLDLFGQLNLSGSERLLVGFRPFDEEQQETRVFSGYDFVRGRTINALNTQAQTLFFEGEFDELFPFLDPLDQYPFDFSFAVGRQPLTVQQGLLINEDRIDAIALTRDHLALWGMQNLRISGIYAWDEVNRSDNRHDPSSRLYALLAEAAWGHTTMNVDFAYAEASAPAESLFAVGASSIHRLVGYCNTYNISVHALASFHNGATESPLASQGELLFAQVSWEPRATYDLVYVNAFWAIDEFTSPARGTLAGGPLGQVGLAFSAASLGRYGPALSNQTQPAVGASIGYQMVFDGTRQQVSCELAGRQATDKKNASGFAAIVKYQAAIGRHQLFVLDSFVAKTESFSVATGARCEFTHKF